MPTGRCRRRAETTRRKPLVDLPRQTVRAHVIGCQRATTPPPVLARWHALTLPLLARPSTQTLPLFAAPRVVVTGSQWAQDEDIEGHLLAGRAGSGTRRRRTVLPMSFREYVRATASNIGLPELIDPAELQSATARGMFQDFLMFVDALDLAWQSYLTTGGFPRAVAETAQLGSVTDSYLADLEAWLHRDVDPTSGPESIPLLLDSLQRRSTSPLSVTATGHDLHYGRGVLDRRLSRMVRSHALLRCPQRDDDGALIPKTQAKYYLTDPLLA